MPRRLPATELSAFVTGDTRVVIRTDASYQIGHGHVMRCLALASELRLRGADVVFVCRELAGHLCELIAARGFDVRRLRPRPVAEAWDPAGATQDASDTRDAVAGIGGAVDWLVVDHYGIGAVWERAASGIAGRVLVIDDLADRAHECDVLLDENYVRAPRERYQDRIPPACVVLAGPRYALLASEYHAARHTIAARAGRVRRVLIAFGGADRRCVTGEVLRAVLERRTKDLHVDVVLSANAPHSATVAEVSAGAQAVTVYKGLPSLAPLIAGADLGFGAAGVTCLERLCLGLPSLVITLAANQRPMAEALDADGFIAWLGDDGALDTGRLRDAVAHHIGTELDPAWSRRCMSLVDARGAARVAVVLTLSRSTPITVRAAAAEDETLLLEWANDPLTRQNSFSSDAIAAEAHHRWFAARIADRARVRLYVAETDDGVPVGHVRFERQTSAWTIHYSVAPECRGRGAGRTVLGAALAALRDDFPGALVVGTVKAANVTSNRVFQALGFCRRESAEGVEWSRSA